MIRALRQSEEIQTCGKHNLVAIGHVLQSAHVEIVKRRSVTDDVAIGDMATHPFKVIFDYTVTHGRISKLVRHQPYGRVRQ